MPDKNFVNHTPRNMGGNILGDQFKNLGYIKIHTDLIKRWEYKDRPENEMGNLDALAEQFKTVGQQVPCIVRPINEDPYQYELIAGERRFEAAKIANLYLHVIVKKLTDTEAVFCQITENQHRKDISAYYRYLSIKKSIDNGFIKEKDLSDKLGISRQSKYALMSYGKIPKLIQEEIGDLSKVSPRTSEAIVNLSKNKENIPSIIELSDKIRLGKIGMTTLKKYIEVDRSKISLDPQEILNKCIEINNMLKNKNLIVSFLYHNKNIHVDLLETVNHSLEDYEKKESFINESCISGLKKIQKNIIKNVLT